MRGYKGFNSDMTCQEFQYELGKTYKMEGDISLCKRGFHFCKDISDCFRYYDSVDSIYCEVEAEGQIEEGDEKCCSSIITIIRELTGIEINRIKYGNGNGNGYGDGYYGNGYGDGYGYSYGDGDGYGYSYDKNIQKILNYKEV